MIWYSHAQRVKRRTCQECWQGFWVTRTPYIAGESKVTPPLWKIIWQFPKQTDWPCDPEIPLGYFPTYRNENMFSTSSWANQISWSMDNNNVLVHSTEQWSNTKGAGYWFMKHKWVSETITWIKEARHRRMHAYGVPFTGDVTGTVCGDQEQTSDCLMWRWEDWVQRGTRDFGGDGNVPELDWGSHLHSGYFYQQSMKKSLKFFLYIIFIWLYLS